MEAYILDSLLRRVTVVDQFESFIWTDRWRAIGDFELVVHSTSDTRRMFNEGDLLACNESDRVMVVESTESKKDAEGRQLLTVKGRSLESQLEHRVATQGMAGLTSDTDWLIDGTPGDVARQVFKQICMDGILSTADIIPFVQARATPLTFTIPEPAVTYSASIPLNSVHGVVKELCDVYDMGFRLVRDFDNSRLYFDIYTGDDRTTQQTIFPAVIFSPDLDSLSNVTELKSIAGLKNVAYVFGQNGSEIVYADGYGPTTSGFERRVIYVDATDVTEPAGPVLTSILQNKGFDALAKNRSLAAFDGEVNQYTKYKPRRDYNLGDLVEMRNDDGATNNMRVTEQIFVSDKEGERAYPTLATESYIMPGTWISWDANETWDLADGTWDEA